jgi:FKBP-type peptidyl-prolyl cis-trans isomerase FkpA
MFKLIVSVFVIFLSLPVWAAQPQTEDQKTLYALGVHMFKQMAIFNLSAEEYECVKQGFNDATTGNKLAADPETYIQQINQLAKTRMQVTAQKQRELSNPYLEKAAAEPGAKKTASGLIYQEIKAGTGAHPKASDFVKVNYTGTLIDGKEFDSSIKRGQPAEFPVGQVIPCWSEGVTMMKVGGKARLVCPANLAYGDKGAPPVIPGGATLVFEVELLEVKSAPAPAAKASAAKSPVSKGKKK